IAANKLQATARADAPVFMDGPGALAHLAGDKPLGTTGQNGAGATARAGANLVNGVTLQRTRRANNAVQEVHIEQEVLPERFLCVEAMLGDDLPERRKAGEKLLIDHACSAASARRSAHRAAILSAAIMASGRAIPWP